MILTSRRYLPDRTDHDRLHSTLSYGRFAIYGCPLLRWRIIDAEWIEYMGELMLLAPRLI